MTYVPRHAAPEEDPPAERPEKDFPPPEGPGLRTVELGRHRPDRSRVFPPPNFEDTGDPGRWS